MEKPRVLSEAALKRRLSRLRRMLRQGADSAGIVFLDTRSFLKHAEHAGAGRALLRLVREIKPYIPIRVTDDSLIGLLKAASGGYERALRFEKRLTSRSLLDFLLIAGGGDEEAWREAEALAVLIRSYKTAAK